MLFANLLHVAPAQNQVLSIHNSVTFSEKWAVRSPSLRILIPLNSGLVAQDLEVIGNWASPLVIVFKRWPKFIGLISGVP